LGKIYANFGSIALSKTIKRKQKKLTKQEKKEGRKRKTLGHLAMCSPGCRHLLATLSID